LLSDQRGRLLGWGGVGFWLLALLLPPLPYLWVSGRRAYIRRTTVHPDTLRARLALSSFRKQIAQAPAPQSAGRETAYSGIEHAVRTYLADRLRLSAKTLTYPDAHDPLVRHEVEEGLLHRLRRIFDECLGQRFSGGRHAGRGHDEDLREAEETIRDLEEHLR
jgi:hypothetical protein